MKSIKYNHSYWEGQMKWLSQFSNFFFLILLRTFLFLYSITAPFILNSQSYELRNLISSESSAPNFQNKIDSFLLSHHGQISEDSLADCYHEIGRRWHYVQWRRTNLKQHLDEAIHYTSKAADLKKKQSQINKISLQKSLTNLGFFQRRGGYNTGAISTYKDLVGLNIFNAKTYNSFRYIAMCYLSQGDYYKAIDILKQGIQFAEKDSQIRKEMIEIHYDLAVCYATLSHIQFSDEIVNHLQLSSQYADKSQIPADKKNEIHNKSIHLNGNRLLKNKQFKKAIAPLKQSLKNLATEDSINLAIAHNSLGLAQFKLGEIESAYNHFKNSMAYDVSYTAALENIGDYYIQLGNFEEGLRHYQKAITNTISLKYSLSYDKLPKLNDLKLVFEKKNLLSHLTQKAIAWKKFYAFSGDKNHLEKGLTTFQLADQVIDEMRFQSFEDQSKLYWQENGHSLYINAVELCYELNLPELAYYFMEKNKALLLLGHVSAKTAYEKIGLPEELFKNEFAIKRSIHLLENNYAQSDLSSSDSIRQEIIRTKDKLEKFQDSIYSKYPEYAKASNRFNILPYNSFRAQFIKDSTVFIHYIVSDNLGYGLLHTQSKSHLFSLGSKDELGKILNNHLLKLRAPLADKSEFLKFSVNSNALFKVLFPEEVASQIIGRRLIIIPDQNIQQLPFESLITDLSPTRYLVETSDVNYQYSISYLMTNNSIQRSPENGFLGMAPQDFLTSKLSSLHFSEEEVTGINEYYPGEVITGKNADKSTFLSSLMDHNIVHLSTHASSIENEDPWIAFADQKMYLEELNSTKNQAEMVTLSACQTSIGEYKKGEGAISLARSFFYSGANSVVASLWSTNDKSSKEIMIEFYRQLSLGMDKSSALQKAKLEYLKNNSGSARSPYYWASTIIIGSNKNISMNNNWSYKTVGILLIILSFVLFLFWKFRRQTL